MSTQTSHTLRDFSRLLGRIFRAPVRLQTYRNLLYLVVMFPLGIFYFNLLFAGVLAGLGLVVVGIGIPLLLLLFVIAVELARLEGILVRRLLNVDITSPAAETEHRLWTRVKRLIIDRRTWKAIAYLLSEFVYGSLAFGLLLSLIATSGSFIFAPLYYTRAPVVAYGPIAAGELTLDVLFGWNNLLVGVTTTFQIGSWWIETLPGALLVTGLGAVLLLLTFQLVNALAWVWGQYARIMLTTPRYWNTPNW